MDISVITSKSQGPKTIRAKGLASRRASKTTKAILAADAKDGVAKLEDFSLQQLSRLFGVSVSYIRAAQKLSWSGRYLIESGQRKLVEFLPQRSLPSPEKQIARVVKQVGVDEALSLLAAAE